MEACDESWAVLRLAMVDLELGGGNVANKLAACGQRKLAQIHHSEAGRERRTMELLPR